MRPKAELVIATTNALNRVVNYYFMMSHTRYQSVINDLELLITRARHRMVVLLANTQTQYEQVSNYILYMLSMIIVIIINMYNI